MEKEIVGYIPKLLYKFYLKLKDRFDVNPKPSDEEKYCIEICNKLIENPKSKLTYSLVSDKRFIKNDDKYMFVIIENNVINLINHVYSYSIYIQDTSSYQKTLKKFDLALENERHLLEDEIRKNIQHSLSNILSSLN